ncbi:MAG: pantoate--beta-alanine ligase [bacterium]
MDVLTTPSEAQGWVREHRRQMRRIGLVPTMGCLHAGHLSLVTLARQRTGAVILSLFVNPTQFGPDEDLANYPRDLERDHRLCEEAGVAALFCPAAEAIYPAGHSTFVEETRFSKGLCGARRPGHFQGVATVVAKLFNIVQPDLAVFGQKDAQQARVIQQMARDLNFPVEIVIGPIIREADGLAMSSRNKYLNAGERRQALCLSRALACAAQCVAAGEHQAAALVAAMRGKIACSPEARADYVEIVDNETLEPVTALIRPALAMLAVYVGRTRLIDNAVLTPVTTQGAGNATG